MGSALIKRKSYILKSLLKSDSSEDIANTQKYRIHGVKNTGTKQYDCCQFSVL